MFFLSEEEKIGLSRIFSYPKLEKELNKVDESLNEVVGESPKEKFNKPRK